MNNLKRSARPRQQGQTMVLFLGFAAAVVGVLLIAFNSGQVSNAKMRAMNAADAAAYSGAVFQARSLNFQAYMNRAMVVNEVTIAQSVSLRSWINYLSRFVTNINYVAQFIPYVGQATKAIEKALEATDQTVQKSMPLMETALRTLGNFEHVAQQGMQLATVVAAQDLAREVAKRNGASLTPANVALFVQNEVMWNKLTRTYSASKNLKNDGRKRLKDVTLDSRDGFTRARDWKLGGPWVQTEIRKQGGTDLIDYDAWKGLDSAEWRNIYIPGKGWTTRIPMGWGGAQSYNPNIVKKVGKHGDYNEWGDVDGKSANAVANKSPNAARNQGGAFPGYRDIEDPSRQDATLALSFAVEVVIKGTDIPSANSINGAKALMSNGSAIEHDPHYVSPNAGVFALSEACVSFDRPYKAGRQDGRTEFPSLFNPYWRASMATESKLSRGIVDGAKKLFPVGLITGDSTCKTKA